MSMPRLSRTLCILALIAGTAAGGESFAAGKPAAPIDYAGFRTGALSFAPGGSIIASFGAEYVPGVTNDVAEVKGNLLRAPTIGVRLGLSENAEFQVSWLAQGWLWIKSQHNPPAFGRKLPGLTNDFGDVTVSTLIQFHAESLRWPAAGLRVAVKLPNSNEKLGIGDNATDFYASALAAKTFRSRARVFCDLGVGILTEPTQLFQQNDVFTYGVLSDVRVHGPIRLLGEVAGRVATHGGGPGTRTSHELRAGVAMPFRSVTVDAVVMRGLAPLDSHDLGVAVHVAAQALVFRHAPRGSATAP